MSGEAQTIAAPLSGALEKLDKPPIIEVVAGIVFDPMELDPLLAGHFWHERRDEFPRREVRQMVVDAPAGIGGPGFIELSLQGPIGPLRAMLFSADRTTVVQMQHDRFYVNWKRADADTVEGARAGYYPRFSDVSGPGLVTRVLAEFEGFCAFCERELGRRPTVRQLELAKVDLLIEGVDWNGLTDMATLLPWLHTFVAFANSPDPSFAVRFDEPRADGNLSVSIARAVMRSADGPRRVVKLETRVRKALGSGDMRGEFLAANADLNNVFAQLIPAEERRARFQEGV